MPQPQEKWPDRITDLPNPELNPMLNPILGRNLGRWAQVYFTTPPERREQAVLELLRELEAESGSVPQTQVTALIHEVPKRPIAQEGGTCTECGQTSVSGQRFCGMCGSPLLAQSLVESEREQPSRPPAPPAEAHSQEPARERVFPTLSLFAEVLEERTPEPSNGHHASEVQWLRDKNLQMERVSSHEGNWSKYGFVLLAAMLLGLLYYANAHRSRPLRRASQPAPAAAAAPVNSVHEKAPAPAVTTPPSAVVVATNPSTPNVTQQPRLLAAPLHSAAEIAPAPSPKPAAPVAPAVPGTTSGAVELATAQSYLEGKNRPRDSAAAANFLWAAVRKENTTALLLLGELYLAGDGVEKNCDQARVLLIAAARKQVPAAVTKLRDLETSGCP